MWWAFRHVRAERGSLMMTGIGQPSAVAAVLNQILAEDGTDILDEDGLTQILSEDSA